MEEHAAYGMDLLAEREYEISKVEPRLLWVFGPVETEHDLRGILDLVWLETGSEKACYYSELSANAGSGIL